MQKTFNIVAGLIIFMVAACQTSQENKTNDLSEFETVKGELYFKLISLGGFYGTSDSTIQKFEAVVDSLSQVDNLSEQDRQFLDTFNLLKKNGLIYKPFFHLKIDSTRNVTVYLDEDEFEKIKYFDRQELINENKKIEISLKGRIIEGGIIDCQSVLSAEKINGETYWRK